MTRSFAAVLTLALLTPHAFANPNPNDLAYRYEQITKHAGRSPLPQPREIFVAALPFERTVELTPDLPASGIVAWNDAAKFLGGDAITVEGRIIDTYRTTGPVVRLQFARFQDDPQAFYVALFDEAWQGTTIKDPAKHFGGKTLRATGPIVEFRGIACLEVKNLNQIEIIGRR